MSPLVMLEAIQSCPPLLDLRFGIRIFLFSLTILIILITSLELFLYWDTRAASHRRHVAIEHLLLEGNEIRFEELFDIIAFGDPRLLEGIKVGDTVWAATSGDHR